MNSAQVLLAYDPNDVKPGWLALWIVIALCVALAILMRSFAKQIKKVDFDENAGPSNGPTAAERDDPPATRGDD